MHVLRAAALVFRALRKAGGAPAPGKPHGLGAQGRDRGVHGQDGFSIIEVLTAVGVLAIVGVSMAGVLAGGLNGVLLGRQRAAATADANLLLETARSLRYADVGLASDDTTLDSDSAITTVTSTNRTYGGEPIVFAQSTANHPFKPHIQSLVRTPSSLTRSIYVTGVDTNADGAPDLKRVTVLVSWLRSAVGGVQNSVTASTLVSANSPGTPGNPPLSTPCPGCPTPAPAPFPPLRGVTTARASDAVLEADVGAGSALDGSSGRAPGVLKLLGVNGAGTNVLDASSKVTCTQQTERAEGVISGVPASAGGTAASNSADSVTNPGPVTTTVAQTDPVGAVVPVPLVVTPAALAGGASCTSSGVTNTTTLPYESGTATFSALIASVDTTSSPLAAPFGPIALYDTTGQTAAQNATQTVPANKQMGSSSTHGLNEMKIMRQTAVVPGVIDIGAPDGLVYVGAYQATATAAATATSGSTSVAQDPAKPLTIKIWDNGNVLNLQDQNGNPVTCDSRSGPYCVITPSTSTQRVVQENKDYCLGLEPNVCLVNLHVEITVTVHPAVTQTLTLPDGITKVYRADYLPVTIVARMWANNNGNSSHLFDLKTTTDAGRIVACAKYGVLPGSGC